MRNQRIAARASFMTFAVFGGTLAVFTLVMALGLVAEMVMLS